MPLLLLLLFNGFILFYIAAIGVACFKPVVSHYDLFLCGAVAFVVVCGLAFLFDSFLGQWFLRLISGARPSIEREKRQLNPVIEWVQAEVEATQGFLPFKKLHVLVVDEPTPNAFAIGKNNLIVSRGLYEVATEDELAAVIAHELGHLHNGDSRRLGIALGVSTITLVITFVANAILAVASAVSALSSKSEGGVVFLLFSLIAMLFSGFFLLFVLAGNGVLKLAMLFVGRKQEYKADQFAVKAGFGLGLLSFLEKVKDFEWTSKKSFLAKLYHTHPPVMLRIGEIEKYLNPQV